MNKITMEKYKMRCGISAKFELELTEAAADYKNRVMQRQIHRNQDKAREILVIYS